MADDRMILKIQALMELAQRAGSQHEAENAFAKAQALMSKHAIDEAMLSLRELGREVEIEKERISFGTDRSQQYLLEVVAAANNCAICWVSSAYRANNGRWRYRVEAVDIYGVKSDIQFTQMLFASLLLFCERSLSTAREIDPRRYGGKAAGYNFRLGFTSGVKIKLDIARNTATKEASEPGTELVLSSRRARAESARDSDSPDSTPRGRLSISRANAYNAGLARGQQADVSGGRNNIRERPTLPGA